MGWVAGCGEPSSATSAVDAAVAAPVTTVTSTEAERDVADRASIVAQLEHGEPVNVLVVVADATASPNAAVQDARAQVASRFAPEDVLFVGQHVPIVAVRLHAVTELEGLEGLAVVTRVEPERTLTLTTSLDLIGQPAAFARGATGSGYSVAVLDTGVDFTHADLGSCASAGDGCPVVFARDFAVDDGTRDDARRHGTNVAAIVRRVAPSVHILALDVFTGSGASSTHIVAALDWVIANRDAYGIVAANMSLGYGGFTSPCGGEALSVALQRVRDANVIPVVATGNDSYTNAIASPGCAPAAVSVGAVDNTGVVASFSNSASFVTLLAPGVGIPAGGVTMSGTSQATPHVAGAFAALRSAYPSDSVGDAIARFVGTGVATRDARNGITLPRLNVDAATAGGETAPPPDIAAPTGTFTFDRSWVSSTSAAFTVSATDASGVASMCVSTAATCSTFVSFAEHGTFTLPTGDGLKTVRLWLRDTAGNTSAPLTATVSLDTRAPTTGAVTATPGIGRVTLTTGSSTDVGAGVTSYRIVFATGTTAPATCDAGTSLGSVTSFPFVHEGTTGTTYAYRVCAVDGAGNVSRGSTASGRAVAELDPPTGTIVLDGGATWTRATRVTATLASTDASAVTQMCLSTSATCTSWAAFSTSASVTISGGSGVRTVNAWFRDTWGNTSTAAATDTISIDTAAPSEVGALAVTRGDATLGFAWSSASDAGSGVASYLLATREGATAPTACTGGRSVRTGSGTISTTIDGLVNGRTYSYRVCAVDVAGNVSRGTTGSATPVPEVDAPTGTLGIAGDATWTRTRAITLAITATDASGVGAMCIATSTTCRSWVAFSTSPAFTLANTQGTQTVRAWLRDIYGNTMTTPLTATITLDSAAPSNPGIRATAGSATVELSVSTPSVDAGSGLARYRVATAAGRRPPSSCGSGSDLTPSSDGTSTTLSTSAMISWRVCAVDTLGNVSSGTTGTATPLP